MLSTYKLMRLRRNIRLLGTLSHIFAELLELNNLCGGVVVALLSLVLIPISRKYINSKFLSFPTYLVKGNNALKASAYI